jgi:hypothetical protein
MDKTKEWSECRTKISPGRYLLKCIKAGKASVWHEGQGGWGRSEKIILWFEVVQGDHTGKVVPMFLTTGNNGKVPQGSKYFVSWVIANGLRRPQRARIKEMPPLKFKDKVFEGEVVDVKPRWITGREQPELFQYSRVDILYELVIGDPNS